MDHAFLASQKPGCRRPALTLRPDGASRSRRPLTAIEAALGGFAKTVQENDMAQIGTFTRDEFRRLHWNDQDPHHQRQGQHQAL